MKILEKVFGKTHPVYVLSLENCSDFLFYAGNYLESNIYFSETFNLSNRLILTNFKYLTESERTKYWNHNNGFYNRASYFRFRSKSDELFSRINYDVSLFSKGILLNSSIDLINIIQESNDTSVIRKLEYLHSIRIQLNKLYEKPISERKINTDSLEILSEKIEKELVKHSKDFGDFTKNLTIKWTDVQHQLRDNDVAIEFVDFPVGTDSTMYSALLLRKGWDNPKMVTLFEKKQIDKLISNISGYEGQRINMIYSGSVGKQLFDLVWKPLEEHIKSGDNVYFSATGVLHQIAIESLPTGDSSFVASDKYSLYRLSSTKQLVSEKLFVKDNKAVLYGGLKYDIEEPVMFAQSQKFGANDRLFVSRGFSLDSTMRGTGWNYLPGTKTEVQEISGKLSNTTIAPRVYMDIYGNEESFKALSGQKNSIIHIASHGFFLPIEEARKTDYFRFITLDENKGVKVDNSMRRSGLILSGGNRAWKGDTIPSNIEDGILTAQEISALDLRGTNLLVLSACETGLGEVSGEGVFGLQRGFKKAGVQTIIMTLWKVNDVATKDMMNEFYGQLQSGKSKREAFTIAQSTMREKYKSPYYWAGFIMLD
ncbi:CHAT domain protein [anaerobic digester metagenome]